MSDFRFSDALRGSYLHNADALLQFLRQPEHRRHLQDATDKGLPAVAGIGKLLAAKFGESVRRTPVKQFIGRAIKELMEDRGYRLADKGIRIKGDPVFTSGSRYQRAIGHRSVIRSRGELTAEAYAVLERIVRALTPAERRALNALTRE
jgi:hypothetical protein